MRGGFRWPWLARATNGRLGLGRWTQEEVDAIKERARVKWESIEPFLDGGQPMPRLRACVERWPACTAGEYNPACCRFPKSCSCDIYDPALAGPDDLEKGGHDA